MAMWGPLRKLFGDRPLPDVPSTALSPAASADPARRSLARAIRAATTLVAALALPSLAAPEARGAEGAVPATPASTAAAAAGRGQLLYETHCIACHTTQMHWRDGRQVQDWASLLAQVRQWQARAQLDWGDEDVQAVARHLNERIYRLPAPERRASLTGLPFAPRAPG